MASSSVPPSASAASVWVVVSVPGRAEPFPAFEIKPPPDDVSDLKKAVKEEMKPVLDHCGAPELEVYYNAGPNEPSQRPGDGDERRLKPNAALVDGHYYWVEAPAKTPAPGCC